MNRTELLLLDASAWIAAVNRDDPFHAPASTLAVSMDQAVAALDLTLYEVGNAIGARDGEKAKAGYLNRLVVARCGPRLLRVDRDAIEAALDVAAEHGLTAYDAAYVALAEVLGTLLVTADDKLSKAPGARCAIEVLA